MVDSVLEGVEWFQKCKEPKPEAYIDLVNHHVALHGFGLGRVGAVRVRLGGLESYGAGIVSL